MESGLVETHVAFQKTQVNGLSSLLTRDTQVLPSNLILWPFTSLPWLLPDCGISYSLLAPESSRIEAQDLSSVTLSLMPFLSFSRAWGLVLALFEM